MIHHIWLFDYRVEQLAHGGQRIVEVIQTAGDIVRIAEYGLDLALDFFKAVDHRRAAVGGNGQQLFRSPPLTHREAAAKSSIKEGSLYPVHSHS